MRSLLALIATLLVYLVSLVVSHFTGVDQTTLALWLTVYLLFETRVVFVELVKAFNKLGGKK